MWPSGGAAPTNRRCPESLRSCTAPSGRPDPWSSPAPVGSDVVVTGMFATAQCQNPDAVGASGSKTVTAKLLVPSGKPDHSSCGETSSPPASMIPLTCAVGSCSPSATSVELTVNDATCGRGAYGSWVSVGMFAP